MAGVLFAYDAGVFRSLTNREFIEFLEALQEMPWSWRNKTQEGETHRPANGERRVRSRHGSAGSEYALRAFFAKLDPHMPVYLHNLST